MDSLCYATSESPWGCLVVASTARGLAGLHFLNSGDPLVHLQPLAERFGAGRIVESREENCAVLDELAAYGRGELAHFTVPLDLHGTDFQMADWQELCRIPYGETRSYGEIARRLGRPKASRAVGMANHNNPIAIIVPCHRVIAWDGTLGGYGGGLDMKRRLLAHEQKHKAAFAARLEAVPA